MTARARTPLVVLATMLLLLCGAAAAAEGTLAMSARLAGVEPAQPVSLTVQVGAESVDLGEDGAAEVALAPGTYPLTVEVAGAAVEGPGEVTVADGERAEVTFLVRPVVALTLETVEAPAGGRAVLRARATTDFPAIFPGTISVAVPAGWRAEGATRVLGGLGAGVPLTLDVRLRAESPGDDTAVATLEPWGATAQAHLADARPATFELRALASELTGAAGSEVLLPVEVANLGGEAGDAVLALREAAGLPAPAAVDLHLAPGERRTVLLPVVVPDAEGRLVLRPYLAAAGRTVAEAEVALRALQANVSVGQTLAHERLVPGEVVAVTLTVTNAGEASTAYTLTARPPEWLEPLGDASALTFQGVLEPGAEAVHAYEARVLYGPASAGAAVAELRYADVTTAVATPVERALVGLTADDEALGVAGDATTIAATVENPLDRPLSLLVRRASEGADLRGDAEATLELAPRERRTLTFEVSAAEAGTARHTLSLLHEGTPVAATATTAVTTKPRLVPVRTVTVRVPFAAEGADSVLIRHAVPGATVVAGSSSLDGEPVPDPVVDADGRAYWLLEADAGELTYRALVAEDLPAEPPAPELTAVYDDREVRLVGDVGLADLPDAASTTRSPQSGRREASREAASGQRDASREAAAGGPDVAGAPEGLIAEPADGTRFRDIDRVRIVVVGPATGELPEVTVNGRAVGRENVGLIQTDAADGTQRVEYYAITLQPGANTVEARVGETTDSVEVFLAGRPARLEVTSVEAVSNGRTPVRVTFAAADANGIPTGFGPLTLETDLEPTAADAFPELPGYQVLLRDGHAVAEFAPLLTAREIEVTARYETLTATTRVLAVPTREALYHFHGSATFGVSEGVSYLAGAAEAYAELPTERGLLQLAIDGRARAPAAGQPTGESGLAPRAPDDRYPVLGAETAARPTLASEDAIAFRYTEPGLEVAYGYGDHAAPAAGAPARITALGVDAEVAEGLRLEGFAGLASATLIEEVIVPDGTRRYRLGHVPRSGGETVLVRVQTKDGTVLDETALVAGRDYTLDTTVGAITLARPLLPTTDALDEKRLVVRYAPRDAARDEPAFGAGLSYGSGPFTASLGGARVVTDAGAEYRLGAEAGYHVGGFGVDVSYLRTSPRSGDASNRFEATVYLQDADWLVRGSATLEGELHAHAEVAYAPSEGPWSATADLATDAGRGLTGSARVAYDIPGALGTAALEHDRTPGRDVTGLVYEHAIDALVAGLGVGWDWQENAAEALARAGYDGETLSVAVEHRQPFTADRQARSELSAGLSLAGGTDLRAGVNAVWGGDVSGRLELAQALGPATAAVTYELPTASGDGNRLRFGVETPLAITDALSLDLSGSYARSFADGTNRFSVGAAARYAVERLQASGAVELAVVDGTTKLVTRFGVTGSPAPDHTLRLAGDFQVLPELTGTLDLAYAYDGRALYVTTYHRLVADDEPSVEGETAFAYRPNAWLQVRPSAAYRVLLADLAGVTVQLGTGVTAYPLEHVGLGANGFYVVQPFGGASAFVWGLEGSYRIDDSTAVAAGYSFGDSAGLTPESRGGWYVRLDVFGGNR